MSTPTDPTTPIVHLAILLDRSGSMEAMAEHVVDGVNGLLSDQAAHGPDARITLVQFDTEDPHEMLADAIPVAEMLPLTAATFVPRGGTPLLDALGRLIEHVTMRADVLAGLGQPTEEVVIAVVTDGHENSSSRYRLAEVRRLVDLRREAGWTFVFLGAGIDTYAESQGIGIDPRSVQQFTPDAPGADVAFSALSASLTAWRDDVRGAAPMDRDDFFRGTKRAERR